MAQIRTENGTASAVYDNVNLVWQCEWIPAGNGKGGVAGKMTVKCRSVFEALRKTRDRFEPVRLKE